LEHTSTVILPLVLVLWVVKLFPQPHETSVVTYSGWMPLFMGSSLGPGSPGVVRAT
jgi:hypothetical protein